MDAKCIATSLFSLLILVPVCAQQRPPVNAEESPLRDGTNSQCVEKLQFPSYTPLARQARLQGTLIMTLSLGQDGTVAKVSAESHLNNDRPSGALLAPIERALQNSQFRRDCGAKQVILVFDFRISGDPYDGQQQEVAFGYPNRFFIASRPLPPTNSQ
jgi:hypothetical protein